METSNQLEFQAGFFVLLARKDDEEMVAQGFGRYVDIRETEAICLEGVAKIYGFKDNTRTQEGKMT